MRKRILKVDIVALLLILFILVGLPLGIGAYDHYLWRSKLPRGAKVFTLTGNYQLGWLPGRVSGVDLAALDLTGGRLIKPVLTVHKGDLVVFKLTSSDVIHGFSLKDFGIFVKDGIRPGKVTIVTFRANKAGRFTFSCNIICGDQHKKMQGTLVVRG